METLHEEKPRGEANRLSSHTEEEEEDEEEEEAQNVSPTTQISKRVFPVSLFNATGLLIEAKLLSGCKYKHTNLPIKENPTLEELYYIINCYCICSGEST